MALETLKRTYLSVLCIILSATFPCSSSNAETNSYPEIKVFVDADESLSIKLGGSTKVAEFVNELIAKVDIIYRKQLGLSVKLSGLHIWEEGDPFVRTTLSSALSSFSEYAEVSYRSMYSYDVAHLLVGEGLGGEGGVAYPASACGEGVNSKFAYGVSQPDISDVYEFNAHLLSHEMGHNLGAEHDDFPSCALKSIMCVAQIGGSFSDNSKNSILNYVSGRAASGCFPSVRKSDPLSGITLKTSISGDQVKYKIAGAQNCSGLTLVASPSIVGLETLFGYLQIGKLKIASKIEAVSKGAIAYKAGKKTRLFVGVYCDGQLVASKASISASKLRSRSVTSSAVTALRSLQKKFKQNATLS